MVVLVITLKGKRWRAPGEGGETMAQVVGRGEEALRMRVSAMGVCEPCEP